MEGKREPLAANDKDFSLALEMTIRESPQSLVTSHSRLLIPAALSIRLKEPDSNKKRTADSIAESAVP